MSINSDEEKAFLTTLDRFDGLHQYWIGVDIDPSGEYQTYQAPHSPSTRPADSCFLFGQQHL